MMLQQIGSDLTINYFKNNYVIDLKYIKLKKNMGPGYCSYLAVNKCEENTL